MPEAHPTTPSTVNASGIYTITCVGTGKVYVGSAVNIKKRWYKHTNELRNNKHYNKYLQKAWDKYGESNFTFDIIDLVSSEQLIPREQFWIDHYKSFLKSRGFNIRRTAGSFRGMRHSAETRAKVSEALKGRIFSPEHRAKISSAHKGKIFSPEHCKKLSVALQGRPFSPKSRAQLLETNHKKKGTTLSPEHRARISEAGKGKHRGPKSPEHRAKLSAANKGKTASPECRAKMSEAHKGRTLTAEHRAKLSASAKARYARARAYSVPPEGQGPYRQGMLF